MSENLLNDKNNNKEFDNNDDYIKSLSKNIIMNLIIDIKLS